MNKNMVAIVALLLVGVGFLALGFIESVDEVSGSNEPSTQYQKETAQYTRSGDEQSSGSGCGGPDSSGCGGGSDSSSSCCGGGGETDLTPEELAREYYTSATGETNFDVVVEDFGCHAEAEIIVDGNIVMKLTISGDSVTEI